MLGDSLNNILNSGVHGKIDKAMMLLVQRASSSALDEAKVGHSKVSHSVSIELLDDNEEKIIEDSERVNIHGDVSMREVDDTLGGGVNKSLTLIRNWVIMTTTVDPQAVREVVHIEIQPNERWTGGSTVDLRAFKKISVIREGRDLSRMTLEVLYGILKTFELEMLQRKSLKANRGHMVDVSSALFVNDFVELETVKQENEYLKNKLKCASEIEAVLREKLEKNKACEVNFSEEDLVIKQKLADGDTEKKNGETTPTAEIKKKPMAVSKPKVGVCKYNEAKAEDPYSFCDKFDSIPCNMKVMTSCYKLRVDLKEVKIGSIAKKENANQTLNIVLSESSNYTSANSVNKKKVPNTAWERTVYRVYVLEQKKIMENTYVTFDDDKCPGLEFLNENEAEALKFENLHIFSDSIDEAEINISNRMNEESTEQLNH
ncbi:hypothetical protein AgCh_032011 [Apium graveolens]